MEGGIAAAEEVPEFEICCGVEFGEDGGGSFSCLNEI
jgi:hypothetical protein